MTREAVGSDDAIHRDFGRDVHRLIVEEALDYAILTTDRAGLLTSWSRGAEAVFGWPEHEAIGQPVSVTFTPEDQAADEPERERRAAAAHGTRPDVRWHQCRDGQRVFIEGVVRTLYDADREVTGFLKIGRDVTERRLTDAALHTALEAAETSRAAAVRAHADVERLVAERTAALHDTNAALTAEMDERARAEQERNALRRHLAAVEEEERRRIARDLHDQLGQHLTALGLMLGELSPQVSADPVAQQRLASLRELAAAMARDARNLALALRPPELDDMGLVSALESYVQHWSDRFHVPTDVIVGPRGGEELSPDAATALYRLAQESLTNVARHARAQQVSVILERAPRAVRLIVEDDGAGFDASEAAARAGSTRRLGLAGMRERTALLGGTMRIESSPGHGTTLFFEIPTTG